MPAPKEQDLTGRQVGEYEVIKRVGAGGMGVVFEGRQPLIGKRVAIKVLLPQLTDDDQLVERFLAEARAVNAIRHRGIVDIFSFGQLEDGSHYFVMEYLDGVGFDRVLKTQGAQPAHRVLGWMSEVLDALYAAHSAGVIHRDVKPSNLFLVSSHSQQYVKLLDFGVAKMDLLSGQATPKTQVDHIIGTPDYMAPEQVRGAPISAATDLYALGCVVFELLTGRRAFRGDNALATMYLHLDAPIPRVADLLEGTPPELDDLITWMLQKDPVDRPSDAALLRQHVEGVRTLFPQDAPLPLLLPPSRTGGTPAPISLTDAGKSSGVRASGVLVPRPSLPRAPPVQEETKASKPPRRSAPVFIGEPPEDSSLSPLPPETLIGRVAEQAPEPTQLVPKSLQTLARRAAEQAPESTQVAPKAVETRVERVAEQAPESTQVAPRAVETLVEEEGHELDPARTRLDAAPPPKRSEPVVAVTRIDAPPEPARRVSYTPVFALMGALFVASAALAWWVLRSEDPEPASWPGPSVVQPGEVKREPEPVAKVTPPGVDETAKTETAKADSAKTETAKADSAKADSAKTDSAKTDAAKTDAAKTDAAKTSTAKTDTAQAPHPAAVAPKPTPKRGPRQLSDADLNARLALLESRITAHEAKVGGRDRVLRQFLSQARADAAKAHTPADRQDVWSELDDLQRQLDGG